MGVNCRLLVTPRARAHPTRPTRPTRAHMRRSTRPEGVLARGKGGSRTPAPPPTHAWQAPSPSASCEECNACGIHWMQCHSRAEMRRRDSGTLASGWGGGRARRRLGRRHASAARPSVFLVLGAHRRQRLHPRRRRRGLGADARQRQRLPYPPHRAAGAPTRAARPRSASVMWNIDRPLNTPSTQQIRSL